MINSLYIVVFTILFFIPEKLFADAYDVPKVVAIEGRKFTVAHDLAFSAGYLPLDAFNKSLIFNSSYTYFYKSFAGWEVANVSVAFNQNTGLKNNLIDNFNAQPQGILDYYRWIASTNYVYTPIYSKNLIFNNRVVSSETSLLLGGGMVGFISGDTAPMFGGGMINRYFFSHSSSLKLDARLYYQTAPGKSSNVILSLGIGYSINFGSSEN